MAAIAEGALEAHDSVLSEHRQILVNVEINRQCPFTSICSGCILNAVQPDAPDMSGSLLRDALLEIIQAGRSIRHLVVAGKEPLTTPDILFNQVLIPYHQARSEERPGTIGMITSTIGLSPLISRFCETPVDWAIISIDTPESGFRTPALARTALASGLMLREQHGSRMIGVNTVMTNDNERTLLELGRRVADAGVDQWAMAPMMIPSRGRMISSFSAENLRRRIELLVEHFGDGLVPIIIEMDHPLFAGIAAVMPVDNFSDDRRWRVEHAILGTQIRIVAANPLPGYFFRLRFDGQLLSKSDFRQINLRSTAYGAYTHGTIRTLIEELDEQRRNQFRRPVVEPCLSTPHVPSGAIS